MQAEINITNIDKLKAGKIEGDFIADTKIKGFRARLTPGGSVVFGYLYAVRGSGRGAARKYLTCGVLGIDECTVAKARSKAAKYARDVDDRKDPKAEHEVRSARSTNTVDYVLDQWLAKYANGAKKLRSADMIKGIFARHVRPQIGKLAIYEVTRKNIADMLDKISENAGPIAADRTLAHVRAAFNWWRVRDDQFVTQPIVKGMTQVSAKSRARKRMLDVEEIRDIWLALDEIAAGDAPAFYPAFVRTLLLTACRRDEVADMHTNEFDGDDWTIPEERYKTKREHLLPLPDAAVAILPKRKDGYIFSSDGGKTPFSGFSKSKTALDAAITARRKREERKPMADWQLRDLRRTVRSRMVGDLRINDQHAKAVLGHVIPGIDGVYNVHNFYEEKKEALSRWATYIINLGSPSDGVVAFPAKQKSRRAATAA